MPLVTQPKADLGFKHRPSDSVQRPVPDSTLEQKAPNRERERSLSTSPLFRLPRPGLKHHLVPPVSQPQIFRKTRMHPNPTSRDNMACRGECSWTPNYIRGCSLSTPILLRQEDELEDRIFQLWGFKTFRPSAALGLGTHAGVPSM